MEDKALSPYFVNNVDLLKRVHRSILGLIFDKEILFSFDQVKRAHLKMGIKGKLFDKMKFYFLVQMMDIAN